MLISPTYGQNMQDQRRQQWARAARAMGDAAKGAYQAPARPHRALQRRSPERASSAGYPPDFEALCAG